jgi:steroid delta-isomerase-like uncharacterized protein
MSPEQNKAAIQRFVERAINQHNVDEFDDYYSPDLVDHALPPNIPQGLAGRKLFAATFFAAFPDMHITIEDLVAEGDKVVARQSARGTHQGELMGIPPTGKQITITGMFAFRFENGRMVEQWELFDQMSMMQQLGVLPS